MFTPEQLRSEAAFIVAGSVVRHDGAWWRDQLRAHAAALEKLKVAESAIERLVSNFKLAISGKPVRDMAETLAEADAALAKIRETK